MISGNEPPEPRTPTPEAVAPGRRSGRPGEEPLRLAVRVHDQGRCEVAVTGEIDFATHRELLDTLVDLVEHGHHRVVLDLHGVTFCDSTGLGVFIQIRQRATAAGGYLRVAAPTDPVRRALEITNLDRLIPAYPTAAAAAAGG